MEGVAGTDNDAAVVIYGEEPLALRTTTIITPHHHHHRSLTQPHPACTPSAADDDLMSNGWVV